MPSISSFPLRTLADIEQFEAEKTFGERWGAETAGYAVPINFLLKAEHIAELLRAADARVLVALGPHPQPDIWEKALEVAKLVPDVRLVQVSAPDARVPE